MAITLRLNPALDELLRQRARQTGRSQASLVTEAVVRLLSEPTDDDLANLITPAQEPYREVPPHLLLRGGPPSSEILEELRADKI